MLRPCPSRPRRRLRNVTRQNRHRRLRIEWLEFRQLLANILWDGRAKNNLWKVPANWSTDKVPGSVDDVIIPGTAPSEVVISTAVSARTIDSQKSLKVQDVSLSVESGMSIAGTLSLSGAVLICVAIARWVQSRLQMVDESPRT